MKFGFKEFSKKTPPVMKKTGVALCAASTAALAAYVIPGVSPYIIIAAGVGAFLTKFFGEDSEGNKSN